MKERKIKKEKGITLIALIITIIIMLILVAVSINVLIKSDLFGAAQRAGDKTKTAYNKEGTMGEIEIGGEKYNSIEEYLCSHEWEEWTVVTEATEEEKGLKRRTCTKCGKVEEKETIKLVIGATIDYKEYIDPSTGTAFETMPSYTSLKTTRGTTDESNDSDAIYTVTEPAEGETGIEWLVLGEEDGKIKITTKKKVTTSTGEGYLTLKGQAGYANFVNELNSIGAIYGKGKYAEGGRSMRIEDFGYGELTRTASDIYAKHKDGKIYRYDATATAEDIANETSTTGGYYGTFRYMAMDTNPNLKEGDEGAYDWKELNEEGETVQMYAYTYVGGGELERSLQTASSYYLADRRIKMDDERVVFGYRFAGDGSILDWAGADNSTETYFTYSSTGFSYERNKGVRPVVLLKSDVRARYDAATNSYTLIDY